MVSLSRILTILFTLFIFACSQQKSVEEQLSEAQTYYNNSDYPATVITLKNLLQSSPDSAQARLLLGKTYWQQNNVIAAKKELDLAKQAELESEELVILLAKVALLEGEQDQAIALLDDEAFLQNNTQIESLIIREQVALEKKDIAQAKQYLIQAQSIDSEHYEVLMGEVLLLARTQTPDLALEKLNQYAQAKELDKRALNLKAQLEMYTQDYNAAALTFSKLYSQYPQELNYGILQSESLMKAQKYEDASSVIASLSKSYIDHPAVLLQEAKLAIQQKDFEIAKDKSSQVLNMTENQTAQVILGLSHFYLGNFQDAYYQLSPLAEATPAEHMLHKVLAITQLELGYTKDVLETMENISVENENNQAFYSEVGSQLALKGKTKEAEQLFSQAKQSAPNDPQVWLKHGVAKLATNDQSGIDDLIYAQSISPESTQSNSLLILAYVKSGDLETAAKLTEEWLALTPDNNVALLLKGNIAQQTGKSALAKSSYLAVLETDNTNNTALYNLAILEKGEDNLVASDTYLKRLLSSNSSQPKAFQLYLSNQVTKQNRIDARAFLQSLVSETNEWPEISIGLTYIQDNDIDNAIKVLESLNNKLSENSPNQYFATLLGLYAQTEQKDKFESLFANWVSIQPDNRNALVLYVEYLTKNAKHTDALRLTQESLNRSSLASNNALKFYESYLLMATEQVEQAQRKANELDKLIPNNSAVNKLLGQISIKQKQFYKAEGYLYKAYTLKHETSSAMLYAQSLAAQNKKSDAISFLESVLETEPENEYVHKYLAELYIGVDKNKAIEHYQNMATLIENDPVTLNNLAWLLNEDGQATKALNYAQQAYQLQPNNPDIIDTLAVVLNDNNQTKQAITLLEEAHTKFPNHQGLKLTLDKLLGKPTDN
ncbi:XrtA/PEP-CTERM system TPR-repeat protein PrsT [Thalassotalea eurytherma]|uniref:PEP-CTERM system TPR-repeat protein PrsT n=1 Tax=Thalassotalea eurytherma TaxID=1144278 RepID=A0ABQ6H5H8_9GAMM|nr:XrtA/PEP-CTERM system TPR-repeat protein PrsT [Thalassotalea eurytherma]GLX82082.1 hypothetical protein theurythT_15340 [Thalassotalea eurytherma]